MVLIRTKTRIPNFFRCIRCGQNFKELDSHSFSIVLKIGMKSDLGIPCVSTMFNEVPFPCFFHLFAYRKLKTKGCKTNCAYNYFMSKKIFFLHIY